MNITEAEFLVSSSDIKQCPVPNLPEYAFIGRSNVGKSSLINMLTNRKKLARISSTPGKTILINHFLVNKQWYLVDLPGYGYAKRSKSERQKWEKMINKYILNRTNLLNLFVLIDSRISPQKIDLEFIDWLGLSSIPFVLVFTKTDKLKANQLNNNIEAYNKALLQNWSEPPKRILTSSIDSRGREEVLDFIENTNSIFNL